MNNLTGKEKQAVNKLIAGLKSLYGANLDSVMLYGSKARGDATRDYDIDVMVILDDYASQGEEFDRVSRLVYAVEAEYDYDLLVSFNVKKKGRVSSQAVSPAVECA